MGLGIPGRAGQEPHGRIMVEESCTPDSSTPVGPFNVQTGCI